MDITENIDKTINCLCEKIQAELKPEGLFEDKKDFSRIAETTNALAALISARADMF